MISKANLLKEKIKKAPSSLISNKGYRGKVFKATGVAMPATIRVVQQLKQKSRSGFSSLSAFLLFIGGLADVASPYMVTVWC